jgi:AcrR family transcriptional regulator
VFLASGEYKAHFEEDGMVKTDRRVARTREWLQKALMDLIAERGYDSITIQDIVDRANLGRTTFYLHYNSKDELFMSCHEAIIGKFHLGLLHPLTREELLSPQISAQMTSAYRHLEEGRALLYPVFQGKDSQLLLRQIRDRSAREIEANLRAIFIEEDSAIPFEMLANDLVGAQIALMQGWLEKRRSHTAESLAQTFHRLQRAAICDALGIADAPHEY